MRRVRIALAAVAAGAVFLTVPAEAPAPDRSKHCGIASKGSRDYRIKARAVKCSFARRWVKRGLRSGRVAPGFRRIATSGGRVPWYCTKGERKAYWPERL